MTVTAATNRVIAMGAAQTLTSMKAPDEVGALTAQPVTGVTATLAAIASAIDATEPAGLAVLRLAAQAAHTLHAAGDASSLLSLRAVDVLRGLHADTTGYDVCPLDA